MALLGRAGKRVPIAQIGSERADLLMGGRAISLTWRSLGFRALILA